MKKVKYTGQDVCYALRDKGFVVKNHNKNHYSARNDDLNETVAFPKGRLCKVAFFHLRKVFSRWGVVLPMIAIGLACLVIVALI